jgi:hypothetical protein
MIRRAIALAALVLMAGTGIAQAKADDSKADCKDGGFASYVDPTTFEAFESQGACVSHVNAGGPLFLVADQLVTKVYLNSLSDDRRDCFVRIDGWGNPAFDYTTEAPGFNEPVYGSYLDYVTPRLGRWGPPPRWYTGPLPPFGQVFYGAGYALEEGQSIDIVVRAVDPGVIVDDTPIHVTCTESALPPDAYPVWPAPAGDTPTEG